MIVVFDFFTVSTVTFQSRETFPDAGSYRYVILDRDSKFDADVTAYLKATGLEPKRTSIQAPWQNGIAERCTVAPSTIHDFVRVRRRRGKRNAVSNSEPHIGKPRDDAAPPATHLSARDDEVQRKNCRNEVAMEEYTHSTPDQKREAVRKLEAIVN